MPAEGAEVAPSWQESGLSNHIHCYSIFKNAVSINAYLHNYEHMY